MLLIYMKGGKKNQGKFNMEHGIQIDYCSFVFFKVMKKV